MDESPGYLLSDTARLMRRVFDERMRALGITGAQARLLFNLLKHEGEPQAFYAERLEVEPITLCRMLDRMEEVDMVERRPNPADRRSHLIFLTAKARRNSEGIRDQANRIVDAMLEGLSGEERTQLTALLTRIRVQLVEMNSGKD